MSPEYLSALILDYRYWILIPISLLEGPVVAFVAGGLAALGYFNFWLLALLFFVRDVGLDGCYYALGHYGGKTNLAQRMLKKLSVTPDHLERVRIFWEKRPGRTMFLGKLSYSIASAFIVVAGMVRMPLKKFFLWGSIVAIVQYGGLLVLGYFFGNAFGGTISKILDNVQYAIAIITIFITLYYIVSWRMRGSFLKDEERAENGGRDTPKGDTL